jgi:hypothetical protein
VRIQGPALPLAIALRGDHALIRSGERSSSVLNLASGEAMAKIPV